MGSYMRIAHLILAHQDPIHIARLAHKLSSYSDVYIHIDARKDITQFVTAVGKVENIFFLQDRLFCEWGGWNSVAAEILLLKQAIHNGNYDRYVFLQGADYPIKSAKEIMLFLKPIKMLNSFEDVVVLLQMIIIYVADVGAFGFTISTR